MSINRQLWGTRGQSPDISPRGYVGLVESCIVSPEISITELVSKYSLHGLNKYIATIGSIRIICRQHELYRFVACMGVIICQFLSILGITGIIAIVC